MKVSPDQSLLDIALIACGSVEAVIDIAELNNLSITDELTADMDLIVSDVVNKSIKSYYDNKALQPATSISDQQIAEILPAGEGIGFMQIGTDFIVS